MSERLTRDRREEIWCEANEIQDLRWDEHEYRDALCDLLAELDKAEARVRDAAAGRIYSRVSMDEKRAAVVAVVRMWKEA